MVVDDRIHIGTEYALRETCKGVPGAVWSPVTKTWTYPASARSMNNICNALVSVSGLSFEDDESRRLVEEARNIERMQNVKNMEDLPDIPGKTSAWMHQRQAFHYGKDFDGLGLFIDMGGGKSKVLVALAEQWESELILICCPRSVMGVWEKQFKLHGLRDYDVLVLNDNMPVAKKAHLAAKFILRPTRKPKVLVCNYDIMWRPAMYTVLRNNEWDLVVHDESHKLKAPGGKASKFAYQLRKVAKKVVLLTGTPMPHGPEDIYAQYRAMDPEVFGTSFARFKNKYAVMGGFKAEGKDGVRRPTQIVGWQNEAELQQKIGSVSYIIGKEEMVQRMREMGMEIPDAFPPIDIRRPMTPKADRMYQSLRKELVAFIEGENFDPNSMVSVDNALTKLMRLRQMTSGFVRTDDDALVEIATTKEEMLYDVLDGISGSEPVVVFAAFHHDLDVISRVAEGLGRPYGELSGRRRDALEADSTLARGLAVAGVQLQSGGVGVDFTRSRYGIYYSLDYNLGNVLQSFARLDRPGQQFPVSFIRLIVDSSAGKPTVDWATIEALDNRKDLVQAMLQAAADKAI